MTYRILQGDVLERLRELPDESVHCVVTSPPYWGLRDYGVPGQIGLEPTPAAYLTKMVEVFREVRRVLRSDGTCWVNMGDSYSNDTKWGGSSGGKNYTSSLGGYQGQRVRRGKDRDPKRGAAADGQPNQQAVGPFKPKDLCGMPWRLAFALQADGWWLRQDIIWAKPNPMPESVTDRCTKAHEYLFLLTKSARYYYDAEAIKEPVTGGAHARGNGVNPKAHGANSKMNVDRDPSRLKASNVKQNSSYSAAINELVGTRNKRSVWEIATEAFPEAHFATFPTKLVEPCIMAGTSEKGCCSGCGAPWVRVIAPTAEYAENLGAGKRINGYNYAADAANGMKVNKKLHAAYETTGWKPGCECEGPIPVTELSPSGSIPATVPCTVLDPFNGSGTTGLVAMENRCKYIGIELNPEYAAMAERRLEAATSQGVLL